MLRVPLLKLVVVVALAVGGCGGSPRDLGTVQPREPIANMAGPWTIVEMDGWAPAASVVKVIAVEVDLDGSGMWIYFFGGDTGCHAVTTVETVRRDPQPPAVTVRYGLRFGVMGCSAVGRNLAIRQPLEPPFGP